MASLASPRVREAALIALGRLSRGHDQYICEAIRHGRIWHSDKLHGLLALQDLVNERLTATGRNIITPYLRMAGYDDLDGGRAMRIEWLRRIAQDGLVD